MAKFSVLGHEEFQDSGKIKTQLHWGFCLLGTAR